jgi:hypothetical protein
VSLTGTAAAVVSMGFYVTLISAGLWLGAAVWMLRRVV